MNEAREWIMWGVFLTLIASLFAKPAVAFLRSRLVLTTDPNVKCGCGELATEPAPKLERGRGSVIRDMLSMPPRYRRVVPMFAPKVYCKAHSHLADAEMAQFVANERQIFTAAFTQAAMRAAAFETEELPAKVRKGMTDTQRKFGAVVTKVNGKGTGQTQAQTRADEN